MKSEFYFLPIGFCAIGIVIMVLAFLIFNDILNIKMPKLATPEPKVGEKCDLCKEIEILKSKFYEK